MHTIWPPHTEPFSSTKLDEGIRENDNSHSKSILVLNQRKRGGKRDGGRGEEKLDRGRQRGDRDEGEREYLFENVYSWFFFFFWFFCFVVVVVVFYWPVMCSINQWCVALISFELYWPLMSYTYQWCVVSMSVMCFIDQWCVVLIDDGFNWSVMFRIDDQRYALLISGVLHWSAMNCIDRCIDQWWSVLISSIRFIVQRCVALISV